MAQGASLFRLLNIVVAVLIVLGGCLLFVHIKSWNSGILGIFVILLGFLTFALEFVIPESIVYNMGFMFSLFGRGLFYISMGLLTLAWKWYNIVVGSVLMGSGLFYIVMHFVGATPSPSMSAVPNTSTTNLNPGTGGASYTNPTDLQPNMAQTYDSSYH
ncbi:Late Golgi vesicles protein [Podila verticillata]|nr:Late Golgi vesicles protein [Podila verticillata]KAI9241471.1 MAG: COPI associated protein-domain-containing protein [Podila humilis]